MALARVAVLNVLHNNGMFARIDGSGKVQRHRFIVVAVLGPMPRPPFAARAEFAEVAVLRRAALVVGHQAGFDCARLPVHLPHKVHVVLRRIADRRETAAAPARGPAPMGFGASLFVVRVRHEHGHHRADLFLRRLVHR